jgi:hypothetical protein
MALRVDRSCRIVEREGVASRENGGCFIACPKAHKAGFAGDSMRTCRSVSVCSSGHPAQIFLGSNSQWVEDICESKMMRLESRGKYHRSARHLIRHQHPLVPYL